ncbi:hypothetical protein [Endozoicomonas sp. SCSIO W0465]|uniref:hypothetical protein n=1 Tax=Endozoicomonas sp. SCSIO W0465 TaxID=2918516 RepID=UPI0020763CD8|nr:hypothetical protein [Endozoicomonas sp. SCSIO W0465]USE38785.1 hypothetical protein MJO57_11795 [Endozoicomonas sp. SCSIO W0465]
MDKISLSVAPSPVRRFDSPGADNTNGHYQSYKVLKNDIAFSFLDSGEDGGCQVKTVFLKLDEFRAFLEQNLDKQDREDYINHVLRPCTDPGHATVSTITPMSTVTKTLPAPSVSMPEADSTGHTSETLQSTAHSPATIQSETPVAPASPDQKSTTLREAVGNISNTQTTALPKNLSIQTSSIRHSKPQKQTADATEDRHASSASTPLATLTPAARQGKAHEQTGEAMTGSHVSSAGTPQATPTPAARQSKAHEQTADATTGSHVSSAGVSLVTPTHSVRQSEGSEKTAGTKAGMVTREQTPEMGTINISPSFIDGGTAIPVKHTIPVTDIISRSGQMAVVSSTEVSTRQSLPIPTLDPSIWLNSDSLTERVIEFLTVARDIASGYQKAIDEEMSRMLAAYSGETRIPGMNKMVYLSQLFELNVLHQLLAADFLKMNWQHKSISMIKTVQDDEASLPWTVYQTNADEKTIRRIINKESNNLVAESYSELGRQYLRILESATKDSQIESLYNAVKNFIEENNGVLKREINIPSISEDFIPVMTVIGQREKSVLDNNQIANPPAGLTPDKLLVYQYAKRLININADMFRQTIGLKKIGEYFKRSLIMNPNTIVSSSEKAVAEFADQWLNYRSNSDKGPVHNNYRNKFTQNFAKESAFQKNNPPWIFINSFAMYGLKMLHAKNGLIHYLGHLMSRVMQNRSIAKKEKEQMIETILNQKKLVCKKAIDTLKEVFSTCLGLRETILSARYSGNPKRDIFTELRSLPTSRSTYFRKNLSQFLYQIRRTVRMDTSDYNERKSTISEISKTISEREAKQLGTIRAVYGLLNINVNNACNKLATYPEPLPQTTLALELEVHLCMVKEFSGFALVAASLIQQIGYDLHFRLDNPQAYEQQPLMPFNFSNFLDAPARKRRDLTDIDDTNNTKEPIGEDHIFNEMADDNAIPDLTNQPEPGNPLSSGASRHRGVWSAISSQLAGLAEYGGRKNTATRPASHNELPREVGEVNSFRPGPTDQTSPFKPASFPTNDSLILANIVASALNDRPIRTIGPHHDSRLNQQASLSRDPLEQSPGMRLLEGSRGVASQLHTELSGYLQYLAEVTAAEIAPCWQPRDLLNIAIVQTTGVDRASPTNAFLQTVLASPELGVEHESPENIFRSDGTVRQVAVGADGQSSVFFDSVTGKTTTTTTGSPSVELARCMLQAMAQHQLKNRGSGELSLPFRQQVLDQVLQLQDRRSQNESSTLSAWFGLRGSSDKDHRQDFDRLLTEQVGKLHQPFPVNDEVQLNPLVQSLNMGHYHNTRQQFMNLPPDQQISIIKSLADAPDTMGLDQSSDFVAQWLRDIDEMSGTEVNKELPDWSSFAISQRAWQLFAYLYDCKVSAPDEAFSRQQLSMTISERQIAEDDNETWRLNQVITDLLSTKSSVSDMASIESGSNSNLLSPVQCHRFDDSKIGNMLDAYLAIKNQVNDSFLKVFGDTVSDPLLKQELTGLISTACLEALKGKLTANPNEWQTLVNTVINEEFIQFTEAHV